MSDVGGRDVACGIVYVGCWMLDAECLPQDAGCGMLDVMEFVIPFVVGY